MVLQLANILTAPSSELFDEKLLVLLVAQRRATS